MLSRVVLSARGREREGERGSPTRRGANEPGLPGGGLPAARRPGVASARPPKNNWQPDGEGIEESVESRVSFMRGTVQLGRAIIDVDTTSQFVLVWELFIFSGKPLHRCSALFIRIKSETVNKNHKSVGEVF